MATRYVSGRYGEVFETIALDICSILHQSTRSPDFLSRDYRQVDDGSAADEAHQKNPCLLWCSKPDRSYEDISFHTVSKSTSSKLRSHHVSGYGSNFKSSSR